MDVKDIAVGIAVIVIGLVVLGLGVRTGEALPDHALIIADPKVLTYTTVPCLTAGAVEAVYVQNVTQVIEGTEVARYDEGVFATTRGDAVAAGYQPDVACRDAGGFMSDRPMLIDLLGWYEPRVLNDGTVRY